MKKYKAFLFDLNGTMINDMPYHIRAWHKLFNDLGAPFTYEKTKWECYGKNHEMLERIFPGRFTKEEKDVISVAKETAYQEEFRPYLQLIDGLEEFIRQAFEADIKMAIGSAAIMMNIDFVLDGLNLRKYFSALVSADDVIRSKPDPETYLKCAAQLNLDPADCLVFEDSPKGTKAALDAGMDSVVITTMHDPDEFDTVNVIRFIENFTGLLE